VQIIFLLCGAVERVHFSGLLRRVPIWRGSWIIEFFLLETIFQNRRAYRLGLGFSENLLLAMRSIGIISFRLPWKSSIHILDIKKIINARPLKRLLTLSFSLRAKRENIGKIVKKFIIMRWGWIFFRKAVLGLKGDGEFDDMFCIL
jgi:hypothetical protein